VLKHRGPARCEQLGGFYLAEGERNLIGLLWIIEGNRKETAMKYPPLVLAIALAMSSSFALAQSTGSGISVLPPGASNTTSDQEKGKTGTTGMGTGATKSTNTGQPNGTAGGPTSLRGTGSSQYGGSTPGTANGK
jgi:hypothetical protein